MSLLARRLQQKQIRVDPINSLIPNLQIINGRLIAYDDNQNNYIVKGYNINDIIYSIVRLITDKARVAPWGIYKMQDEQAYKSLQATYRMKDYNLKQAANLHKKALVPFDNAGKWNELIKYPNFQQGFNDFVADGIAFKLLTGNKYIWANMLSAGANAGTPYELYLLPSQWVNIYSNGLFPAKPTGYMMIIIPDSNYTPETILHEKYFNPNYDVNGNQLYGMAPLRAGLKRLQKSNLQLVAEAASWQNEGIKGIVALKNNIGQASGEEAQQQVQLLTETLRNEWQGPQNRGRMGTSGYDLSWIPIGLNSEEMSLIESGWVDIAMLCNIFGGVPDILLNNPKASTYNNVQEAEKALTTRIVLPELCATKDGLNRKASQDWGLPKNAIIDFDMTYFSELQEDVGKVADWTSKLIAVIPDEQREQCGLSATGDPLMKEIWVMQSGNRIPLSEFNANAVDNALNNPNVNP